MTTPNKPTNHHSTTHIASGFNKNLKNSFGGRFSAKAILAVLIFGMIIAVFVVSDFNGRQAGQLGSGPVATVNGTIISRVDFDKRYQSKKAQYASMFGGMDLGDQFEDQIRQTAINELVDGELAFQAAKKDGLFATDSAVRQKLLEYPAFVENGVFKTDTYKMLLKQNQWSPSDFENLLRHEIIGQKVRSLFNISYKSSGLDKKIEDRLKSFQMKIQYIKLSKESFDSESSITQAEVDAQLKNEDFKKKVTESVKLKKSEFEKPEQVKASHILVRTEGENAEVVKLAEDKAKKILARLAKEDFAKVAREVSDDPGSKTKGGDLGFFARGSMAKEFEDVAFKLKNGETSSLVKTQFGFHIIKTTDKKAATSTPEIVVNRQVGRSLMAEEKFVTSKKQVEEFLAKLTSPIDLNAVNAEMARLGLKWINSDFFDLATEVIPGTNSGELFKASVDLSTTKPITAKLIKDGDNYFLARFVEAKVAVASTAVDDEKLSQESPFNQKAMAGMSQWTQAYKEKSKVEINVALVK